MALGSILEAPGLDFKGFWDRFFENVRRFLGSFGKKVFLTGRTWPVDKFRSFSDRLSFDFWVGFERCSKSFRCVREVAVDVLVRVFAGRAPNRDSSAPLKLRVTIKKMNIRLTIKIK